MLVINLTTWRKITYSIKKIWFEKSMLEVKNWMHRKLGSQCKSCIQPIVSIYFFLGSPAAPCVFQNYLSWQKQVTGFSLLADVSLTETLLQCQLFFKGHEQNLSRKQSWWNSWKSECGFVCNHQSQWLQAKGLDMMNLSWQCLVISVGKQVTTLKVRLLCRKNKRSNS